MSGRLVDCIDLKENVWKAFCLKSNDEFYERKNLQIYE